MHNIRVIVKSSGHEMQGRSAGSKDSLMIWMSTFTGVEIHPSFTTGCPNSYVGPAVTSTGGSRWGEVYRTVSFKTL